MKKYLFLATALAFAGCASDEFVGEMPNDASAKSGAIVFSAEKPNMQRAILGNGEAAEKLNSTFMVYGTKHLKAAEDGTIANDMLVFDNYQVKWVANSAGNTLTNTHNWDYFGLKSYNDVDQTIKYWDNGADYGYTFYAMSAKELTYPQDLDNDKVIVEEKITAKTDGDEYDKGYKITIKDGATLDDIYFSDRTEVAQSNFNEPVQLKFRNFGAKVRVAFFETVPGYNVTIDGFYKDADATSDQPVTDFSEMSDLITESATTLHAMNVAPNVDGNTFYITYYDGTGDNTTIKNQADVTNGADVTYSNTLTLGDNLKNKELKDNAAEAIFDKSDKTYTNVFPNSGTSNPMLLKVDYTLTSTDGSDETIKVTGARVMVPAEYIQWKSNFAYTYLFKISENTNGYTGNDPSKEGLFPITFDAVVEMAQDATQELVTNFGTNSVSTYANGSKIEENKEYKAGEVIYFVNTSNTAGTIIEPTNIGSTDGLARIVKLGGNAEYTEQNVVAALNDVAKELTLTDVEEGLVEEIPLADGTTIKKKAVKWTAVAGTYAYIYTQTAYVAADYDSQSGESFDESETYYKVTDDGVYYTASGVDETYFNKNKASLYLKTSEGTTGKYDIKIVVIQ